MTNDAAVQERMDEAGRRDLRSRLAEVEGEGRKGGERRTHDLHRCSLGGKAKAFEFCGESR